MKNIKYVLIAVAIVLVDQLTKLWIVATMEPGQSLPVVSIFHITYVQNTGASFGLFANATWLLAVFSVALLIALIAVWNRPFMARYQLMAAVIAGGAIGNFLDRIFRGFVVDMFDFTYFWVFNVADIAITCGVALLCIQILRTPSGGEKSGGKRK